MNQLSSTRPQGENKRNDIDCPYCGQGQEINHDDGYGYSEDEIFNQECVSCEKIFTFSTSIHFYYSANAVDCLNGGEHKYKKTITVPRRFTKMRCKDCGQERKPTDPEMEEILTPVATP